MGLSLNYIHKLSVNLRANKVAYRRAVKATIPFLGMSAAGLAVYNTLPDFRNMVDHSRNFLNKCPLGFEMLSSAIALGIIPDYIAQRYQGDRFNWRRFLGLTALGAAAGGIIVRGIYDFQAWIFPGEGPLVVLKKLLFDRFVCCPPYMLFYFSGANLVRGISWKGFENEIRTKGLDLYIKNCIFFGICLPIVFSLPSDLRIYAMNLASMVWYAYLSKRIHD